MIKHDFKSMYKSIHNEPPKKMSFFNIVVGCFSIFSKGLNFFQNNFVVLNYTL